jgi:hypothetical protein
MPLACPRTYDKMPPRQRKPVIANPFRVLPYEGSKLVTEIEWLRLALPADRDSNLTLDLVRQAKKKPSSSPIS